MYPTAAELLPTWLRVVWAVLLLGVLAALGPRIARTPAPARWWYAAYALMALAMIVMYGLNPMDTPGFNGPALLVFVVALVGVVALVVGAVVVRSVPWVVATLDMVTLAYIQIPADVRPVIVCVLFACYLVVVAALRATAAVRTLRGAPQRGTPTLVDPGEHGRADAGGAVVPIALAVLALAMLYMLSV